MSTTTTVSRLPGPTPITFPAADPFLDPNGATDPNPLDDVDPAWGLPAGERIAALRERSAA